MNYSGLEGNLSKGEIINFSLWVNKEMEFRI
jgi:hypothetical protein